MTSLLNFGLGMPSTRLGTGATGSALAACAARAACAGLAACFAGCFTGALFGAGLLGALATGLAGCLAGACLLACLLVVLGDDFTGALLTTFVAVLAGDLLGAFAGCREDAAGALPVAACFGALPDFLALVPGLPPADLAGADALVDFLAGATRALTAFFAGVLAAMSGVPPGDVNAGLYRLGPGFSANHRPIDRPQNRVCCFVRRAARRPLRRPV